VKHKVQLLIIYNENEPSAEYAKEWGEENKKCNWNVPKLYSPVSF